MPRSCSRRELTRAQSLETFRHLEQRWPILIDEPADEARALELAVTHHISYWDCCYLALAVRLRCPVVTADGRFSAAAARVYPMVEMIADR